jgi:SAM-dependent methyltransferase
MNNHVTDKPQSIDVSDWVRRWSHLVSPRAKVLDVACGGGRHLAWFEHLGCQVTGVDIDTSRAQKLVPAARLITADIENQTWPLLQSEGGAPEKFDVVVVTNYLWRPLLPTLQASLEEGGLLIYETFASGNETVGRPARPEFLLRRGELLDVCESMRIIAFEDGFSNSPERFVQRVVAAKTPRNGALTALHARYAL